MQLKQISCVLFLFSLLLLAPEDGFAQFEKGHKIIGGNFGFSYINNTSGEYYQRNGNFRISPTLGYFLSQRSMIGISPTFSLSTSNASFLTERDTRWGYGATVFYRRFIKASDKFHFFIEPSIDYSERNNSDFVDDRLSVALLPGLVFLASEKIWLEAKFGGLRYESTNFGNRDNISSDQSFHAGLTSFTTLGIYFIIK